jgi:tetratricopeptide (TPR) repeat protein
MRLALTILAFTLLAGSQEPPSQTEGSTARLEGKSSSKDTKIDISPPEDDRAKHPDSEDQIQVVGEMKPWNPHKAMKDVEVGDYYFKRANYRAAISRYREALEWKPRDAVATYRLALALEKSGARDESLATYKAYLDILPKGPYAEDCRKAIERLSAANK